MKLAQAFLFPLLVSILGPVAGQVAADQARTSTSQPASAFSWSVTADADVDTVTAPNAPSGITRKIRQDSRGNLLIASMSGVVSYDGESFTDIPEPPGVESFDAFDVLEDSKGRLWIASTHFGVFVQNGEDFKHYTKGNGLAGDRTIDIHEDRKGNIWIATDGGASRYAGESWLSFTTEDGLPDNDVNAIIEDRSGNIWIGTRGKAAVYDGRSFSMLTRHAGEGFENVRHMLEDSNGHIWLGGADGLWRYDGKAYEKVSSNFTGYIYEGSDGDIWTSSAGDDGRWGLSRYDNGSLLSRLDMPVGMTFGIEEDADGRIWIGTTSGVASYDGRVLRHFSPP